MLCSFKKVPAPSSSQHLNAKSFIPMRPAAYNRMEGARARKRRAKPVKQQNWNPHPPRRSAFFRAGESAWGGDSRKELCKLRMSQWPLCLRHMDIPWPAICSFGESIE